MVPTAPASRSGIRVTDSSPSNGPALPGPFDGEESVTLLPDLDAGARGTMPSCSVPDVLAEVVRAAVP